jgi:PIN domain nuclease of toxin-antitoxin system
LRLLLDTHVVLWQLLEPSRIGPRADAAMRASAENIVSVLAFAEVGIKVAAGKLKLPGDFQEAIGPRRILRLEPEHGLALAGLPMHHRDPFDRLLIAQAMANELTIVTADPRIAEYAVDTLDANA